MKLLSMPAVAEVRPTGYRITTRFPYSHDLVMEAGPHLRDLLERGAMRIEIERRGGASLEITVREWGDD